MQRLDIYQDIGGETLPLGPKSTIGQKFVTHHDNLAGIRFSVSNPRLGGSQEYKFSILDDKQVIIRSTIATESNLGWEYTFRYDFNPISLSKDKTYMLLLSYLESTSAGKLSQTQITTETNKNPLVIGYTSHDSYKEGSAFVNNQPLLGDLTFSTYYQVNLTTYFKDSFTEFKVKVFQDKPFVFGYLLILIVLTGYLIHRLIGKNKV